MLTPEVYRQSHDKEDSAIKNATFFLRIISAILFRFFVSGAPDQFEISRNVPVPVPERPKKTCCSSGPIRTENFQRNKALGFMSVLWMHLQAFFFFLSSVARNFPAYGDDSGEGDSGDHWEVICNGDSWHRDIKVQFRHNDTKRFLLLCYTFFRLLL